MTKPRSQQICLEATSFYHCVSRTVRRAFLCGKDQITGRSYEHRRHQIERDIRRLASIFFIDIAAYAVLSNHYHLVLHINQSDCAAASAESIVRRWHCMFSGTEASQKFINKEPLEFHEQQQLDALIDLWRSRLESISWFMKVLNENVARKANKEDNCTGHFWASRYKSQALLDEKALLSAMAYVDLNPIRAGMASTLEDSNHTSIKQRIEHWRKYSPNEFSGQTPDSRASLQPTWLMPFAGNPRLRVPSGLPFALSDYIELVEWTGRIIRDDKKGFISASALPVFQQSGFSQTQWIDITTNFEDRFKGIVGSVRFLEAHYQKFKLKRKANRSNSQMLFG